MSNVNQPTNYDSTTTTTGTNAPGFNKPGQTGYHDEGMGMGPGHYNNAIHGGVAQGNLLPDEHKVFGAQPTVQGQLDQNAPMFGQRQYQGEQGDSAVGGAGFGGDGAFRRGAEGAVVGGAAGHEYDNHNAGGHGFGTGAATGAMAGHEYNRRHDNRVDAGPQTNATRADHHLGTTGETGRLGAYSDFGQDPTRGYGSPSSTNATSADHRFGTSNAAEDVVRSHEHPRHQHDNVNDPTSTTHHTDADAKHLARSGKVEKVIGSLVGSASMKEKGLQKQAEAAAIRADNAHVHPRNDIGMQNNADTATGIQPSYGPGTGAPVGGGVGGGSLRKM